MSGRGIGQFNAYWNRSGKGQRYAAVLDGALPASSAKTAMWAEWAFGTAVTGYTITANNGTYAVTGQSSTITKTRLITANNGTYAVTGQSSTITKSRLITANNGTYGLTGQTVTITYTVPGAYTIAANNGTYAITGQTADITYTASPFIVIDTHDGDYHKKLKQRFDDENQRLKQKRKDIITAYERIVEGKPALADELTVGFEVTSKGNTNSGKVSSKTIDFDRLANDLDRVERLWNEYIEMEDEDWMVLL